MLRKGPKFDAFERNDFVLQLLNLILHLVYSNILVCYLLL